MKTKLGFNPLTGDFDLITSELDADEVVNVPSGNLAATDVQGALNELQSDVDTRATSSALTAHTGASSGVHGVTGAVVGTTDTQNLTNKTLNDTSNVVLKGGNATGTILRIGTTDANELILEAQGNANFRINNSSGLATEGDAGFFSSVRGFALPKGTQAQRPSAPQPGTVRLNTDTNEFEGFANSTWQSIGGGLNEQPLKNYLKPYATAAVSPGALSTVAAGGSIATTAGLFYSTSTGTAFTLSSSSSTALRGSFNYLSGANTAANVDGSVFFQFPATALESSDLGKPVSISFDITGLTSQGWDVVIARYNSSGTFQALIPVAGTASSSTSTPSALLPTGTAQFKGFFVPTSTAGDLYALRFRRITGAEQIRLDTIYVGPQVQLSGAAVTDWQAYTPTTQGLGTVSSVQMWWRQDGQDMLIYGRLTPGTTTAVQMQVGLYNNLAIGASANGTGISGQWWRATATGSVPKRGTIISGSGNTYLLFGTDDYTTTQSPPVPRNADVVISSGEVLYIEARVPISTWSSNVTSLASANPEYASFDGTAVQGIAGALVPNTAFATGDTTLNVTFDTPIQATDSITIQYQSAGAGPWMNAVELFPYFQGNNATSANRYGILMERTGSNVRVNFGNQGIRVSASNVSNGAASWATQRAAGDRWRVRKQSPLTEGILPVSARAVVGDTTGTAVPSGFIGETRYTTQTFSGLGAGPSGFGASTVLTAGIWMVKVFSVFGVVAPTKLTVSLANSGGTTVNDSLGANTSGVIVDAGNTGEALRVECAGLVLRLSASTTYTVGYSASAGAGGQVTLEFVAVRIA